jgi:hypothetical protein
MIWQLPEKYSSEMCKKKSGEIYQHVYDKYWGSWNEGQSVYGSS